MESCTDGPIEDDDESDDNVSKSYRRKCLSPEIPSLTSQLRSGFGRKRHVPTQSNSKHRTRKLVDGNVRGVTYPVRNVVPSGPGPVSWRDRVHILVAPFARRGVSRRLRFQGPIRRTQVSRKLCAEHGGTRSRRNNGYLRRSQR